MDVTELAPAHPSHMLLGELASRFMSASETLERSYRELQARVAALSAELEREREEKLRLEKLAAMGEMAMELAHEIRNPLGSIELYASMTSGEHAEQIVRSVQLLNLTVSNILQFGTQVRPVFETVSLQNLFHEVGAFLKPIADRKAIGLQFTCAPACAASGDFDLLRRLLLNLALNALRETPSGGEIRMSAATAEPGEVLLRVEDTGPGIPPDILGRIFDPLFSTHPRGCGLGLSIAKRIVESHNGSIGVESSPAGTVFSIRLKEGWR